MVPRVFRLSLVLLAGAVSSAMHAGASYSMGTSTPERLEERLLAGMVVTLWGEIFKLVLNFAHFLSSGVPATNQRGMLTLWLPAVMYVGVNTAHVALASRIDPGILQSLLNLKIVPTAVFSALWLRKPIATHRGATLAVLLGGTFLVTSCGTSSVFGDTSTVLSVFLYCCASALAGATSERRMDLLPRSSVSEINTVMTLFSIVGSVPALIMMPGWLQVPPLSFEAFAKWPLQSLPALLLVLSQATTGILVSYLIRYEGNVGRLFLMSAAPVVATLASMIFFHVQYCALYALGSGLVLSATDTYVRGPNKPSWVAMCRAVGWCTLTYTAWWAGGRYAA